MNEETPITSNEAFDAISHPLRIKILKLLAKKPLSFNELKRAVNVDQWYFRFSS